MDLLLRQTLSRSTGTNEAGLVEPAHRWIDESQVPVLSDTHDDEAGLGVAQHRGVAVALGIQVGGLGVQPVEPCDRHVMEKPLPQKSPERGRVRRTHARVFIHVERGKARPVDGVRPQRGQKRVLGNGGGEHNGGPAFPANLLAD